MAIKKFKHYTKSTRRTILVDRSGLWKGKPFKSLVSPKNSMKGRNNYGRITSINRAGGHKKMYRHVDFYRKKFELSNSLIILDNQSKNKIEKSIRNIPNIKVTDINHFSAFDIVKFKKIVFTESSIKELEKRYS